MKNKLCEYQSNNNRLHRKFQYNPGLNIDTNKLDSTDSEYAYACAKGLYFTTLLHVHSYYSLGCDLVEVFLPTDNPDFQMVQDRSKYRADMIILSKTYSLFESSTYEKFKLKMPSTE